MDLDRYVSCYDPGRDFQFYKEKAAPGYHFVPTNSEMVHYLLLREQGHPHANYIFPEVPLNDYNPDELQRKFNRGKGDELYVYAKIKPLKNGWRVERKGRSGRWKNLKRGEDITEGDKTTAYKTTLTYYVVKDGKEEKTCWSMQEYRLHRKKSERQMGDDVVLCKIYKRGGAGKTSEAVDEETGGSIGSCNSLRSSTTVSNGLRKSFPDVHSPECFETADSATPTNGSSVLPMAAVNDPFQFAVSPIEDSATPMNIVYGSFSIADEDDPCQFARLPSIEHLPTLVNGWGDFTMADANEHAIQFSWSPIEDFNSQMVNVISADLWNS